MKPSSDSQSARIQGAFADRFRRRPQVLVRAPGRVNLLGGHVDMHGCSVLPGAIDRAIWLAAAVRDDSRLRLAALDLEKSAEVELRPGQGEGEDSAPRPGGWTALPLGLAWALGEEGHAVPGMDVAYGGDLPIGAGLSSSAAVEMAFLLAWEAFADFSLSAVERARIGRRCENEYLGVGSGIMDQLACLEGRKNSLLALNCHTLEHEPIELPAEVDVLVADSGVRRSLSESGYNLRQQECREALDRLQAELPELESLGELSASDLDRHGRELPPALRRRARHVVDECRRVLEGAELLRRGDLAAFGQLMRQSHLSSRELFEVTIPELDALAEIAWALEGCFGARLAGGGFGGSVVALVESRAADRVEEALAAEFQSRFGRRPESLACRLVEGAGYEPIDL